MAGPRESDLSCTDASDADDEPMFEAVQRPSKDPVPKPAKAGPAGGDADAEKHGVGAAVEARWMEPSRDGKYHYYPATVEIVHGGGAEYTVRWNDPDSYDPTLRLKSKFVRDPGQCESRASKPRDRRKRDRSGRQQSAASVGYESDHPKPLTISSRGRQVLSVSRFTAGGRDEEALQRTLLASARQAKQGRPSAWEGDVLRETAGRKYYGAVRLQGSAHVVRVGDCVMLRPTSAWRSGWESGLPWVAMVRDLFEDESSGEMFYSCVWFYRPQDCSPKALLRDTLQQHEVFLTDEMDDNNVRSIMRKCRVLDESEFRQRQGQADQDCGIGWAVSDDEEDCEEQQEDTLLCRFRYDVTRMVMTPIGDTAAALRSAASSMLVEKRIMQHIRDFQIKWIGCLHRYGHYKETKETNKGCQDEPAVSGGQRDIQKQAATPKAGESSAGVASHASAGRIKSLALTSPVVERSAGRSRDGALGGPSPTSSQASQSRSSSVTSGPIVYAQSTPSGGVGRKRSRGAFADTVNVGARTAQPLIIRSSSSPSGKSEDASPRHEPSAAVRRLGLPQTAGASFQPISSSASAKSERCDSSSCTVAFCDDQSAGESRETPVLGSKRSGDGSGEGSASASKKQKSTKFGYKKQGASDKKPLQYVHAEFVDAKWDDGFYYPAFIVKRLSRGRADNFKECLVEWSDPEGYPGYWETSGYSRTAKVRIEDIRPAKGLPPSNASGPSAATMKIHCTAEDWQKAAEKAAVEQSVADAGLEWHPNLSIVDVRSQPGCQKLWICTARHCGQAFTGLHFLRAHQLSKQHGKWKDLTPLKETVAELDCTRSGDVTFVSKSVERNCRKLVRQISSSEEPRIDNNVVPGKVLHTGENGRGFALFASRDIKKDEYVGHYSGSIKDIGYKKRFSGHYTFGLLHCWAMDGTAGGAWRFMNHCLERHVPTVRALIVNHFGVPHIALYANRDIKEGEELLLRYGEISDSEFFGVECGQD